MCQICGCEPCEACGAEIDGSTGECSGCGQFSLDCRCVGAGADEPGTDPDQRG